MATMKEVFGYKVVTELGRGAFGTVCKGIRDGTVVAMKAVSKNSRRKASMETVRCHFMKENIDHENIVKVNDIQNLDDSMWIIMEFCDLGDLNQYFSDHSDKVTTMGQKLELMLQISTGIDFLHRKNIIHRDIKPANILVKSQSDEAVVVKLTDFGLTKILDADCLTSAMSSDVGTLSFKAPEFWDKKPGDTIKYHRNVDVYAAGLTLTAMLQADGDHFLVPRAEGSMETHETMMPIGLAVFSRMTYKQSDISIVEDKVTDQQITTKSKNLIRGMTQVSPEKRLSSREVTTALEKLLMPDNLTPIERVTDENARDSGRRARNGSPVPPVAAPVAPDRGAVTRISPTVHVLFLLAGLAAFWCVSTGLMTSTNLSNSATNSSAVSFNVTNSLSDTQTKSDREVRQSGSPVEIGSLVMVLENALEQRSKLITHGSAFEAQLLRQLMAILNDALGNRPGPKLHGPTSKLQNEKSTAENLMELESRFRSGLKKGILDMKKKVESKQKTKSGNDASTNEDDKSIAVLDAMGSLLDDLNDKLGTAQIYELLSKQKDDNIDFSKILSLSNEILEKYFNEINEIYHSPDS